MATKSADQSFEFDIMAVVIQVLQESGTILGDKHYALMAAVDGKRSKSAFQHLFRTVKACAKDIGDKVATGEINVAATAATTPAKTKARTTSKSGTPASSKRKARSEKPTGAQSEDASCAQDEDDEEMTKTPAKKVKGVKKEAINEEESFFT